MTGARVAALAAIVAALAIAAAPARAHADTGGDAATTSYRAVIDRIDLEPAAITGNRLRVYLSALTLDGALLDLSDPKSIRLYAGDNELKLPYALGRYGATTADTAVVIVVEATGDYSDALAAITDSLDRTLLGDLGDHVQVAVLTYGEQVGSGKLGTVKQARSHLGEITADATVADPVLLDTLDHALLLLKRAKTKPEGRPLRKMIVVIGDGRDRGGDRDRVTRLGKRAAAEGVRIHALGHSPGDLRRPLLLLGELAKQSLGTFRWVRSPATAESWDAQLKHLHDELTQQYVLTYFVPEDTPIAAKTVHVVTVGRTEATSNALRVPQPTCAKAACEGGYCAGERCVVPLRPQHRGILGWLLWLIGVIVAAIVVLLLVGYTIARVQRRGAAAPKPVPVATPPAPSPAGTQLQMQMPQQIAPVAPPPPATSHGSGPRGTAQQPVLYFMSGPRAGQTVPLKHGFTIGKAPTADLVIDDGYASTTHAQIAMDHHGNCQLYDRGSTNGTFVNGVRVTEYGLSHGVSIRIGSIELRFLSQ